MYCWLPFLLLQYDPLLLARIEHANARLEFAAALKEELLLEISLLTAPRQTTVVAGKAQLCTSAQYWHAAHDRCAYLRNCSLVQYEATSPALTTDRECAFFSKCKRSQYEQAPPTPMSDRDCRNLSTCDASSFETAPPSSTSDRECKPFSMPCQEGYYETSAPTSTSDRRCAFVRNCSALNASFEVVAPTWSSDRVCGDEAAALEQQLLELAAMDGINGSSTTLRGHLIQLKQLQQRMRTLAMERQEQSATSAALLELRKRQVDLLRLESIRKQRHTKRQKAVVKAFLWAWDGYSKWSWGRDELMPVTKKGSDWLQADDGVEGDDDDHDDDNDDDDKKDEVLTSGKTLLPFARSSSGSGSVGLTLVDSLDTMLIMGLRGQFELASAWVQQHLDFASLGWVNAFEICIRVLGGLLSAYFLAGGSAGDEGEAHLLAKAVDLGERLLPAFTSSASGIPYSDVHLATGRVRDPEWAKVSSLAEATSMQLEMRTLAHITARSDFHEAAERVTRCMAQLPKLDGLPIGIFLNASLPSPDGCAHAYAYAIDGTAGAGVITLGARGDSYYEYLLKQWLLTNRSTHARGMRFARSYVQAVEGISRHLVKESTGSRHGLRGRGTNGAGQGEKGEREDWRSDKLTFLCEIENTHTMLHPNIHAAQMQVQTQAQQVLMAMQQLHQRKVKNEKEEEQQQQQRQQLELELQQHVQQQQQLQPLISPKMDHLACFLPGLLALGAAAGVSDTPGLFPEPKAGAEARTSGAGAGAVGSGAFNSTAVRLRQRDITLAERLGQTCYQMYARTATGLAPEISYFTADLRPPQQQQQQQQPPTLLSAPGGEDLYIKDGDEHNLLRPETVESLFLLYRLTKKEQYREWGWQIFSAFEKHCRVSTGGYASLINVSESTYQEESVPCKKSVRNDSKCTKRKRREAQTIYRDKMESFFTGETLKYLFLLFSDDSTVLPLDQYVFNTEAHPLPVFEERHTFELEAAGVAV
jgi:hypothetical protein